jgi:acyl-CoA thioester hydrolase
MSEPELFTRRFEVRWADLDANRHLSNTAFLEYATHTRFAFLAEHGFPPSRFGELNFGPVILREEMLFYREVGPDDLLTVDYRLAGMSEDGRRFRLHHRVWRRDGALAAEITTEGGWMDLSARKMKPPPSPLLAALGGLVRTTDFEDL